MFKRRFCALLVLVPVALIAMGTTSECSAGLFTYSVSATNPLATPNLFAFDFSLPLPSPEAVVSVTNTLTLVTLTDTDGDGASLTPVDSPFLQLGLLTSNGGATITNAGVDVGPMISVGSSAPVPGGVVYTFGPYTAGSQAGPIGGPYTGSQIHLAFSLSAHDSVAITGSFEVTPSVRAVPEPSTVLLMGIGVLGSLSYSWHRRVTNRMSADIV